MRRTLILAGLLLVLITGVRCTMGVTIPEGLLMDIAQGTLEVGHPMAGQATGARVVGGSPGGCGAGTRYVDVEIGYRGALSGKQYFMTVRYDLVSIDPCEVSTDVIADTGPIPPVLLDNAISSTEVGRWVCESLQ
jgi:hypothetical protein